MKIYIQENIQNAWKWIGSGYAHAFAYLDHEVIFVNDLSKIDTTKPYKIFFRDDGVNESNIHVIKNSLATYLYVQANYFPDPWGKHPSWQCHVDHKTINTINTFNNVIKWSFCSNLDYFTLWKNVNVLPLAFDDINYKTGISDNYKYDICFIGSIADNGYNEKIKIIENTLNSFINAGFKCGFSVNQNISHDLENHVLINSKIALNIHDAYQRKLGLDSNERTFKSLGVNGVLLCDEVQQVKNLFPFVYCNNDNEKLINKAKEYCSMPIKELNTIKMQNQKEIASNHTYIKRVEKLLSLK